MTTLRSAAASAPGKLFIAGEYAVTVGGHWALIAAVNRYVRVTAQQFVPTGQDSPRDPQIHSDLAGAELATWHRDAAGTPSARDGAASGYVLGAIAAVEALAWARGLDPLHYDLHISSDLTANIAGTQVKIGLGSSAAVTAATVRAVARLYDLNLTDDAVLKLALLATHAQNKHGSGGDVAAAVYGGWIKYSSPRWPEVAELLEQLDETFGPQQLLAQRWPGLSVTPLHVHEGFDLLVGWTGSPADTAVKLSQLDAQNPDNWPDTAQGQDLLTVSDKQVHALAEALERGDYSGAITALDRARQGLLRFAVGQKIDYETPKLTALAQAAIARGAGAKASGAGGGDCGIALLTPSVNRQAVIDSWTELGAVHVELQVAYREEK